MKYIPAMFAAVLALSLTACTPNLDQTSKEFAQQITEKYPVGSDEQVIIRDLSAQGYVFGTDPQGQHELYKRIRGFACNDVYIVHWHVDASGKIKDMHPFCGTQCM